MGNMYLKNNPYLWSSFKFFFTIMICWFQGYPTGVRPVPSGYLVEVNSRSKHLKKPKFYKRLSIILAILALLLLFALIAIIITYSRSPKRLRICTTDKCLRSASNLRNSLDYSIDPCDDFYKYTCGRWSEEHPNHGWFSTFSTFSTITERILITIVNFLTSEAEADEPKPVKQTRDLYKSCMDSDAVNKLGLTPLLKYLKEAELPLVPSLFTKSDTEIENFKFDWLRADAVIKKTFAMDVFVGFGVDGSNYNRSENVMYIGAPGNWCPLPSPLKHKDKTLLMPAEDDESDYSTRKTEANKRIIKFVITEIIKNVTSEEPKEDVLMDAIGVLLNISSFVDELKDNYTVYDDVVSKPYSIMDYEKYTNDFLINNVNKNYSKVWQKYLNYLFNGTNVTIEFDKDLLYIEDTEYEYLPKVLSYILTTSDIYLELYMWWVTVFSMIINTSSEITDYIFEQTAPFYTGNSVVRAHSLDCATLVNNFMGLALSYGVADRAFSNQTKPKVEQMLYDIKRAFIQHVNTLTWMDKETKGATLEKAKEMVSFIGYPEWLFNKSALEYYYKGLVMAPDTYLDNMMSMVKVVMPSKFAELRTINERTWRTDPTIVNAFNSFSDNAINVPMAILTFPIYDLGLEVLNYGAIGSVLGHELTHGFDNTGRKHDKFGNHRQWWSNETIETFEEKIQCFIKQYDNFTVAGVEKHVQGKQTLGENLADNGGLNHAYIAYQNFLKRNGAEPKLPGFENFTHNQLFFVAFGSIWCETTTVNDLKDQIDYDEHCPQSIRVIGTLQNSKEFAEAFGCPAGSKMNPSTKCLVW